MSQLVKIRTATPASRAANERRQARFTARQRRASPYLSRRQRKRYRAQLASEATAAASVLKGGWGKDSELRPADLLLIRQAIREGWDVPQPVRDAIVREVVIPAVETIKPRMTLAAIRVVIAMVKSNRGGFDRRNTRSTK